MSNEPVELDRLETHFEEIIKVMAVRFTSHEFFQRLAYEYQIDYVAGLTAFAGGGKPFRDLHHALVKRLKKLEGKLITQRKTDYPSRDIFGIPSHSGLWRKL
jgi:hypothetical protein